MPKLVPTVTFKRIKTVSVTVFILLILIKPNMRKPSTTTAVVQHPKQDRRP
ncbi:hypothetical protein HanIR_Chr01g0036151 [Helianthus annuus]|nr:hypothetical protein HanIR_Chr01g0036151 [Helianthus annuus]